MGFPRQHIGGRYLVHLVEDVQISGEPPDDGEAMSPPQGAGVVRQPRPRQREIGRDRRRAALIEVVEELAQQLLRTLQLVAQRPAQTQVVGQGLTQRAHAAPPGHGRASSRSPSRSTLA